MKSTSIEKPDMDNSDDYFFDDIVLDDQTLAILDQTEQKYLKERSVPSNKSVSSEPINKRLKTSTGWIPGSGSSRVGNDELPEISLHGDGTYGINNRAMLQNVQEASNKTQTYRPTAQTSGSHFIRPRPAYPANDRRRQSYQVTNDRSREQNPGELKAIDSRNSSVLEQLAVLQSKLDELREENSKMKSALQEAVDNKLAKDGEVSILKKNMEKNAQKYANQISTLKAEKDKMDAKRLQMQKEMKEEIELLRTQFLFRQQELESSIRKPPASVRAKKHARDFPSTPLPVPAVISSWNKGTTKPVEETPVRSRRPPSFNRSPSTMRVPKSPEKIRNGMLPGFENAFETSTPLRSPSKKSVRYKGDVVELPLFPLESLPAHVPSQFSQGVPQFQLESSHQEMEAHQSTPSRQFVQMTPARSQFGNDTQVIPTESDDDSLLEDIDITALNWKAELSRIILTHSSSQTGEISFQQMLNLTHHCSSMPCYTSACRTILDAISNPTMSDDYSNCIQVVSVSFLSLLTTLLNPQPQPILSLIFDLLTNLILSLPEFQASLLSCELPPHVDKPTSTIDVICFVIIKYLQPTRELEDGLASATLTLLESLCFHVSVKAIESLEPLVQNRDVFMTLLHSSQPAWLLERTSRLLVTISTYHDFHRSLLKSQDDILDPNNNAQIKDPLFERLCFHLTDSDTPASSIFKSYILTYFAQLSISHRRIHRLLAVSYTLIPALVLYISLLTSSLWEDDGSSPCTATSSIIAAMHQAVLLLYHLIFGTEPGINLRYTLQHASHKPFNSINHIFVVTFGRLSYCEPPNWIQANKRQELEHLAEVSREILELVVDGPEGDNVWAAFQNDPEEDSMLDEGEMEARFMGSKTG